MGRSWISSARTFHTRFRTANLRGIQASPIDYLHAFNLPAGRYTVESVLFDREANRASSSTVELESPPQKGIALSSLLVVARADPLTADADANDPFLFHGRDVIPVIDGPLKATAKPSVYFVVYPDKFNQETPKVRAEFFVGGRRTGGQGCGTSGARLFRAIPMVVSAVARPGKCQIKITVRQGFQSAQQSVSYYDGRSVGLLLRIGCRSGTLGWRRGAFRWRCGFCRIRLGSGSGLSRY